MGVVQPHKAKEYSDKLKYIQNQDKTLVQKALENAGKVYMEDEFLPRKMQKSEKQVTRKK